MAKGCWRCRNEQERLPKWNGNNNRQTKSIKWTWANTLKKGLSHSVTHHICQFNDISIYRRTEIESRKKKNERTIEMYLCVLTEKWRSKGIWNLSNKFYSLPYFIFRQKYSLQHYIKGSGGFQRAFNICFAVAFGFYLLPFLLLRFGVVFSFSLHSGFVSALCFSVFLFS